MFRDGGSRQVKQIAHLFQISIDGMCYPHRISCTEDDLTFSVTGKAEFTLRQTVSYFKLKNFLPITGIRHIFLQIRDCKLQYF